MKRFIVSIIFAIGSTFLVQTSLFAQEHVGYFEAEGQKIDTRFVRVLFAAQGEESGDKNDMQQLIFDSKDPNGNPVKVFRYQITLKNTGYETIQTTQQEDYKLKSVENGIKLHIEVPIINNKPEFSKAYVGNLAYNFGTRDKRNILSANTVNNIHFKLTKLELPTFDKNAKPGDKGIVYNQGYLQLSLQCNAQKIDGSEIVPFKVEVNGPISITHVRGSERADRAVTIDTAIVKKNIN